LLPWATFHEIGYLLIILLWAYIIENLIPTLPFAHNIKEKLQYWGDIGM